jgi:hypothetical protein
MRDAVPEAEVLVAAVRQRCTRIPIDRVDAGRSGEPVSLLARLLGGVRDDDERVNWLRATDKPRHVLGGVIS